jgi:hypothetical protein
MDTGDITFTGSETPSEIANAAIEWFLREPNSIGISIFYEDSIPKMKYELQAGPVECVCVYRLDKMLESFYSDAAQILDENVSAGFVTSGQRAILLPYIAFSGMTVILTHLVVLQAGIFLQTAEDARMLTAGLFLHSLVSQNNPQASLSRPASKVIQKWIDKLVATVTKKKRDYLVGFMNSQRLLQIPTSVGRPPGTKKPEQKKREDAALFAEEVEAAIRKLYIAGGKVPTKTAVAKYLRIGGMSPAGSNTSLGTFRAKLKRLSLDYNEIAEKVNK